MRIESGTKLGPYEVVAPIGAGGMGEVYKAQDRRLDRTVAVKVLPEALAKDAERKERFEREAKAISQLNHPHICTLYDVGEEDGVGYLVMEYIAGDTLAHVLQSGPLPVDKALEYATQTADALDKAHRAGIVHRDLKPANIIVTKSGVKLLDFGLARLVTEDTVSDASDALTQQKKLTKDHTVVGTLHYMSPEQLEGKSIDTRADIFAFGAVFYEMVTGKTAFEGDSTASLITAIMSSEPRPVSELRRVAPTALDRVVKKCLAKDRDSRWQTALDLRDEIVWIRDGGGQLEAAPASSGSRHYAALAATAIIAAVATWAISSRDNVIHAPVRHFTVPLPPDVFLPPVRGAVMTTAGDGSRIAFMGERDGTEQLFVRATSERDFHEIPGTQGARHPTLSADGERIAFDLLGKPYTADVDGGRVVLLADSGIYPNWGPEGYIYYWNTDVWRVPADGGTPEKLTEIPLDRSGGNGRVKALPNGKAVLIEVVRGNGGYSVDLLELATREIRSIVDDGGNPRYASSGYILFTRAEDVFAVPFDAEALRVTGTEFPVGRDIRVEAGAAGQFDVATDGTLVYAERVASDGRLVRVDLDGDLLPLSERIAEYEDPRVSPDGRFIALTIRREIWRFDVARDVMTRITFQGGATSPVWSSDGREIAFASGRIAFGSGRQILRKPTRGTSEASSIAKTTVVNGSPSSWSPDGNLLIVETLQLETGWDLQMLRVEDGSISTFLDTPYNERAATFSPDGRFVAFESDDSGRFEIFVVSFPEANRKWQISTDGGRSPRWSRSGDALFYRNGDAIMAVSIEIEDDFIPHKPRRLFDAPFALGRANYDVLPNDEGFVMVQRETPAESSELHVIQNWYQELNQIAPTSH